MASQKGQLTIEATLVTIALIIAAVIVILWYFTIYSNSATGISQTGVYGISSILFYPQLPLAPASNGTYPGSFAIQMYSSQIPVFSNLILVQDTGDASILSNSTCPAYAMFTGFPTTGIICTSLSLEQTLSEGSDQYLITYDNSLYNITSYNQANGTSNGDIIYVLINRNGQVSYEHLNPPVPVSVSSS